MTDGREGMDAPEQAAQQEADQVDAAYEAGFLEAVRESSTPLGDLALPLGRETFEEPADNVDGGEIVLATEPMVDVEVNAAGAYVIPDDHTASIEITRAADELTWPVPVIPQTNIAFPYDIACVHRHDGLPVNAKVIRTADGEVIDDGSRVYGEDTPLGDVMRHLPAMTEIIYGEGDARVMVVLRATEVRPPIITVGRGLHYAVVQLWPWLVTEGHAQDVA